MSWYHKILLNQQNPKRLLTTNVVVAVVIALLAVLCSSKIFIGSSFVTFIVSGATLLYLILMRWQMVLPTNKEVDEDVKYPLSTKSTILYSLLLIIFWAMFPPLIMTAVNLIGRTGYVCDIDILYHLYCSFFTFCAVVVTLVVGLVAKVILLIKVSGVTKEWWRLYFESLDVICTIALYFVIYAVSFMAAYCIY